jgi:iron-sulfur cluster repair protein YtfE (RIC family)
MLGEIDNILDYVTQLEQDHPELKSFIHQVRELTDNFDLEQLRTLTQKYRVVTEPDQ